ncbi:MAG: PKD domain-containing protein [Bacteroidia bacterium]
MLLRYSAITALVLLLGCKKQQVDIPRGATTHYSQEAASPSSSGAFSFTGITINPNPVKMGTVAKVTAVATGKNLSYKWSTPHGDIFGTGQIVYYSNSCVGTYQIICTVSDGSNSATITVNVTITD